MKITKFPEYFEYQGKFLEPKFSKVYIYSMRNRCGNLLGSAWRQQMETISKNINISSNDMKTQTGKCHTFSVLLFNQLSLYIHLSWEFFHLF